MNEFRWLFCALVGIGSLQPNLSFADALLWKQFAQKGNIAYLSKDYDKAVELLSAAVDGANKQLETELAKTSDDRDRIAINDLRGRIGDASSMLAWSYREAGKSSYIETAARDSVTHFDVLQRFTNARRLHAARSHLILARIAIEHTSFPTCEKHFNPMSNSLSRFDLNRAGNMEQTLFRETTHEASKLSLRLGHYGKAVRYARQVIAIGTLQPKSTEHLEEIRQLAISLTAAAQYEEAERVFRDWEKIVIHRVVKKQPVPNETEALGWIQQAELYLQTGDYQTARNLTKTAGKTMVRGGEIEASSWRMIPVSCAGARCLLAWGDYAASIRFIDWVSKRLDTVSVDKLGRPELQDLFHETRGLIHLDLGEYQKAYADFEAAHQRRAAHFGSGHPGVANNLIWMARVKVNQGDTKSAKEFCQRAEAIQSKRLGNAHPAVIDRLNCEADIYLRNKRYELAKEVCQINLKMQEYSYRADHPSFVPTLLRLAHGHWATNQLESIAKGKIAKQSRHKLSAINAAERAFEIQIKNVGRKGAEFARVLAMQGRLAHSAGRPIEAFNLYQRSAEAWRQVPASFVKSTPGAPIHPDAIHTYLGLTLASVANNDLSLADKYWKNFVFFLKRDNSSREIWLEYARIFQTYRPNEGNWLFAKLQTIGK